MGSTLLSVKTLLFHAKLNPLYLHFFGPTIFPAVCNKWDFAGETLSIVLCLHSPMYKLYIKLATLLWAYIFLALECQSELGSESSAWNGIDWSPCCSLVLTSTYREFEVVVALKISNLYVRTDTQEYTHSNILCTAVEYDRKCTTDRLYAHPLNS